MILVTGGTGLLGSHLLYELLKSNQEIKALKRPSSNIEEVKRVFNYYPKGKALFEKINWVDGDMLNYSDMLEAMEGVDQIYHCAAIVSFEPKMKIKMIASNTNGTANLVNAAIEKKIKKFLHVSSTSAIGKAPDGETANESMVWAEGKTNTGYSISKFRSEMEVWRGVEEGLNAVIVNPSIILGAGYWLRGSSSMFSTMDKGMKYYTHGTTGYVGVWDVVKAMTQLMESNISGERFLVTADNYSYKQIFDLIAEALNKPKPKVEATKLLAEIAWRGDKLKSIFGGAHTFTKERVRASRNVRRFDNRKVKEALGIEFEPVEDVIKRVADFYKRG